MEIEYTPHGEKAIKITRKNIETLKGQFTGKRGKDGRTPSTLPRQKATLRGLEEQCAGCHHLRVNPESNAISCLQGHAPANFAEFKLPGEPIGRCPDFKRPEENVVSIWAIEASFTNIEGEISIDQLEG